MPEYIRPVLVIQSIWRNVLKKKIYTNKETHMGKCNIFIAYIITKTSILGYLVILLYHQVF